MLVSNSPTNVSIMQAHLTKAYHLLRIVNDILLIPMFLLLVHELGEQNISTSNDSMADWLMTLSFFLEWSLGFILAKKKKDYFFNISNFLDFISCFPFGVVTKSLRIIRFMRVFKVVRVVTRANRYKGPAEDFIRLIGLVGATIFAGAYSIEVVEPSLLISEEGGDPKFSTGLWWAWVTISTVGYGDVTPTTTAGRLVATPLIGIGVGVCGYISAYMMRLMSHQEEKEPLSVADIARLEAKLDRLAKRLEIEDWDHIEGQSNDTSDKNPQHSSS